VSGFAAIFRFDGAPADPAALGAMIEAIAYRGPDGIRQWVSGPAAIGHLMLHTTAESLEDVQPLASEDETLVLAMDGWLANYDELRDDLLARGAVLRTRSDAELVLRAYQAWGDDCPRHLHGEYAFVVWDARRREAFCAKDHAGMRPLHYHWDGKRLLVASDLAGVLAAGDFEPRLDTGMAAEHLANHWFSLEDTLWQGVSRLLPARSMRVGAGGPVLARHWLPPLETTIRYRRDEDYVAHYRELFERCVRQAARSHAPLACEVSGGLDSSAVFAMAHKLLDEGRLPAPGLLGYTFNFGELADSDHDELAYGHAVAAHWRTQLREVRPFMPGVEWFAERGRADRDIPTYPNNAMTIGTGWAARADGCRVLLNGEGGDEFLSGNWLYYADDLVAGDWRNLWRGFRADSAASGPRRALSHFWRYGVLSAAPPWLRGLRRRLRTGPALDESGHGFDWLSPKSRAALRARAVLTDEDVLHGIRSKGRRGLFMALMFGFGGYVHDYVQRTSARVGYEVRSPMYAKDFIDFAFAIPHRLRFHGSLGKHIHREAMRGLLPPRVLQRATKANFYTPFLRILDDHGPGMVNAMLQCGEDLVDGAGLEAVFARYQAAGSKGWTYELWAAFGIANLLEEYRYSPSQGVENEQD
jgi:asparagine synthase (glutamine-hydrolysing)